MQEILNKLGLQAVNAGTWYGGDSSEDAAAELIESVNPATGDPIASVRSTTRAEYETLIETAQESFRKWRTIPAPVRGNAVRLIANALRENKDALGSLVSLEMGKIKAEGDGEVQEMIDIADFAVGQSRMLYGQTMHSERPEHRMYEQWHPLGLVGTISAFNFPVAVYAWNACLAAICGNVNVWKPSPKTPLCGVAVQKIISTALAGEDLPPVFFLFYGLLRGGQESRRTRDCAHGQTAARTRRQQRNHRRRIREPRSRRAVDRIRVSRHSGPALHHDAARHRAPVPVRRTQGCAGQGLRPGAHR
jgi:aldehyde dehydrogenase (NAD+)